MATPPDEFFHRQERELMRYTDARIIALLKMLESARKDLQASISEVDTFSNRRLTSLSQQIDQLSAQLNREIQSIGQSATGLAEMTKRHLEASVAAITGRDVVIAFDRLNLDILRKFSENELVHVSKLTEVQLQKVKSVLFTKVGVKGQNPAKVARELAGKDSQFTKMYGHLENIFRTETSNIYNAQSLEGIQHVNQEYDLDLNKRIVETIDTKRNHPISLILNNLVQAPGKPFKVSVAAVQAKANVLRRGAGGVLWPVVDGFYVGQRLPAHYHERGVMVPTEQEVTAD